MRKGGGGRTGKTKYGEERRKNKDKEQEKEKETMSKEEELKEVRSRWKRRKGR